LGTSVYFNERDVFDVDLLRGAIEGEKEKGEKEKGCKGICFHNIDF